MKIFLAVLLAVLLSVAAGYGASLQFSGAEAIARCLGMSLAVLAGLAAVTAGWTFMDHARRTAAAESDPEEKKKLDSDAVQAAICFLILVFVTGGLLAVLMTPNWLPAFFWALAALLGGGLVGLLAALPTVDGPAPTPDGSKLNARKEQVSALGKAVSRLNAVIGGGVAFNWKDVYAELKKLAARVGESAGGSGNLGHYPVLGAGLLLYFGLLGLIAGILLTRIFLIKYLEDIPDPTPDPSNSLSSTNSDSSTDGAALARGLPEEPPTESSSSSASQ
jgi:hypothetical protein